MKQQSMIIASFMLCGSLFATEQISPQITPVGINPHQAATENAPNPPRQHSPLQEEERQQTERDSHFNLSTSHNRHVPKMQTNRQMQLNSSSTSCTQPAELFDLSGEALVTAVRNADLTSCLYGLYNTNFAGTAYFTDTKLLSIVQSINNLLINYDGTTLTGATELEKLVTYLRAAHWSEGTSRVYSNSYRTALKLAFDQYFAAAHFVNFNGNSSRNFMVRYEMLILLNSSKSNNLPYMARFGQAITGYANSVNRVDNWGVSYEENGMTQLLTHYFNAVNSGTSEVKQLLLSQPEIIASLQNFVMRDGLWLVDHTREYQWSDAISELARLLKFQGVIADSVRPAVREILSTYAYAGTGSKGWINAQTMVLNYDANNCNQYGDACDFDLESTILSGLHICSDSIKVRFQQPISSQNLQKICQDLTAEELYFHTMFNNPAPVKNDNNTDLEVVIFSSSTEYKNYAGGFFNIGTDNGGMYLEGTPSAKGNQARFIAYQATWLSDFTVWNLEHEYVHYLDARFNQWGSFSDQPQNSVWWGEGLAEYLSKQNNNENALAVAPNKTYSFSELLQTTYANSNTERTYHWGYLATRFMFEKNRNLVDNDLLPTLRAAKYPISDAECLFDWQWRSKQEATENNWSWLYDDSENASGNWVWTCGQEKTLEEPIPEFVPYAEIIGNMTGRYDLEFNNWLDCIVAGDDCSGPVETILQNGKAISVSGLKGSEQHFGLNLPENGYDLRIFSQGSGDLDLYVRQLATASLTEWDFRPYKIGSKEQVNILRPKSNIDIMLHGYSDYSDASLTATWQEGTLTAVQEWSALSSQSRIYKWVYIPSNAKAAYFTLDGGSGDAQLYVKQNGWPATNDYDGASSITRGTTQKIKLENVKPGNYYHILVNTLEGFTDVTLSVSIVE